MIASGDVNSCRASATKRRKRAKLSSVGHNQVEQQRIIATHQAVDTSRVKVLRQAQEMRRRGWLSIQESNLLDLALADAESPEPGHRGGVGF